MAGWLGEEPREGSEGAKGNERAGGYRRKTSERADRYRRETRERAERTPSTSATRFNYTLQTHDMSKSYTSYRLCHLLKVSSRAPRSRHRCSAAPTPSLTAHPENISKERPEIYERKVREKRAWRCEGRGYAPQIDTVAALRAIKATALSFFSDSLFYLFFAAQGGTFPITDSSLETARQ